jgi:hypothetical protein
MSIVPKVEVWSDLGWSGWSERPYCEVWGKTAALLYGKKSGSDFTDNQAGQRAGGGVFTTTSPPMLNSVSDLVSRKWYRILFDQ